MVSFQALISAAAALLAAVPLASAQANGPIELTPKEFYETLDRYDVIVDVRAADEWEDGHIPNATFVESLAKFGDSGQRGTPSDLAGCEYCDIAVYCSGGVRAGWAIEKLIAAGFKGRLYNGMGTDQWKDAGYPIVSTPSVVPPCTTDQAAKDACFVKYEANQNSTADGSAPGDTSGAIGQRSASVASVTAAAAILMLA